MLKNSKYRVRRHALMLSLVCLLSACASLPGKLDQALVRMDNKLDATLSEACPVPVADSATVTPAQQHMLAQLHALRAELVLASVAGYAADSINSYSRGEDAVQDAMLVLARLKTASSDLATMNQGLAAGNHLYPIYRADFYLSAGRMAEAAMRPAVRAVRADLNVPALLRDVLGRSGHMLEGVLKDAIYLGAIKQSCQGLNVTLGIRNAGGNLVLPAALDQARYQAAAQFTEERIRNRCVLLTGQAKLANADGYCVGTIAGAGAGAVAQVPALK